MKGDIMTKCDKCPKPATNFVTEENKQPQSLCDECYGLQVGIPALKNQNKFVPPDWGRYSGNPKAYSDAEPQSTHPAPGPQQKAKGAK